MRIQHADITMMFTGNRKRSCSNNSQKRQTADNRSRSNHRSEVMYTKIYSNIIILTRDGDNVINKHIFYKMSEGEGIGREWRGAGEVKSYTVVVCYFNRFTGWFTSELVGFCGVFFGSNLILIYICHYLDLRYVTIHILVMKYTIYTSANQRFILTTILV